jgi:uncharacterized protein (DUF1684 family)
VASTLDLLDYRRQVEEIYARVRSGKGADAWEVWRDDRDRLFRTHPQTPLDNPTEFVGLPYFPYGEQWRTDGVLEPEPQDEEILDHSGAGSTEFLKVGNIRFTIADEELTLAAFWLKSYAGGLFVPFRDATSGSETYGGGRYLIDSAKGADLGSAGARIVLDFNYAYHPSCVHSDRWSCPLAPTENRLPVRVVAGERLGGELEFL